MFRRPVPTAVLRPFSAKDYSDVRAGHAFSGINAVGRATAPGRAALESLRTVDSYTRHKEVKKPKSNPYFVHTLRELGQGDLCDKSNLSEWNDGVKFILCIMDTFSRFLWVRSLKNKSASTVNSAMREIFAEIQALGAVPGVPVFRRFLTDAGTEFLSASARQVYREFHIEHQTANVHASHVERKQRDLQHRIGQYLTENETRRYIHVLPGIVEGLNSAMHRIIHMTPRQAERDENHDSVRFAMSEYFEKSRSKSKRPGLAVGEWVRIVIRELFRKSYDQTYTTEFYKVKKVLTHMPRPMYILEDPEGNEQKGFFYEEELSPYRSEDFKIKRVLKRRRRRGRAPESLVEWLGFPKSQATWIADSATTREFDGVG